MLLGHSKFLTDDETLSDDHIDKKLTVTKYRLYICNPYIKGVSKMLIFPLNFFYNIIISKSSPVQLLSKCNNESEQLCNLTLN